MRTLDGGVTASSARVRANGIDIHYLDQGEGEPLVLRHGGMVSRQRKLSPA